MKIFKRIIKIVIFCLIAAVIGYFAFTACQL